MTDWNTFYKQHDDQDNIESIQPDEWQIDLANTLMCHNPGTCLEAGSGHGLTSLLLDKGVQKILLDLELSPLLTAKKLFASKQQQAVCTVGDALNMPFPDHHFDLVFNSGVLEHFDFSMRQQALKEMLRVTVVGGIVVAAIPNHYSIPYRYSYKYRKKRGDWPYPDEHKLYDFSAELQSISSAGQQTRTTISPDTAYHFLRRHQRVIFKLRNKFQPFEGYLTIITVKKLQEQANHIR